MLESFCVSGSNGLYDNVLPFLITSVLILKKVRHCNRYCLDSDYFRPNDRSSDELMTIYEEILHIKALANLSDSVSTH